MDGLKRQTPIQGLEANVNWSGMKNNIKDNVTANIQNTKDVAKETIKGLVDPLVDAGCVTSQSMTNKAISEKTPMVCAPIILKGVNLGANAITPSVKNGVNLSIDKCMDYSAQKSTDVSVSVIEKTFDSLGNETIVEVKSENESPEDVRDFEFDLEGEQNSDEKFKQILQ